MEISNVNFNLIFKIVELSATGRKSSSFIEFELRQALNFLISLNLFLLDSSRILNYFSRGLITT